MIGNLTAVVVVVAVDGVFVAVVVSLVPLLIVVDDLVVGIAVCWYR